MFKEPLLSLYTYFVKLGILKPLERVKREQERLKRAQRIQAARDHLKFMRTTIFKQQYRNKTYKDYLL